MGNLYDTMAAMVEEEENHEILGLSPNEETESPQENMQDSTQFIAPHIHLFKTDRFGETMKLLGVTNNN